MRGWVWAMVLVLAGQGGGLPRAWGAGSIEEGLRRDVAALAPGENRSVGTQGAKHSADYVVERLEKITGQKVWRQKFLIVVPEVAECAATVVGADGVEGDAVPMAPLLPAGGQGSALAGKEALAEVVYAGKGTLAELAGKTIDKRWVAVEIGSDATAWQTLAGLGARGLIFVGPRDASVQSFMDKAISVPVTIPRFYCDDVDSVAAIREGSISKLKIRVHVRWIEKEAENLLCLIPGRQDTPKLPFARAGWTDQLVLLQARVDGSSQVMGRAPGAEQAAGGPAVILRLAESLVQRPDHCSTLIMLTEGDEWQFRGTRMFEDLVRPENKSLSKSVSQIQKAQAARERSLHVAEELARALERLAKHDFSGMKDRATLRAIRDQLDREASRVQEDLERARLADPKHRPVELEARKDALVAATGVVLGHRAMDAESEDCIAKAAEDALPMWRQEIVRQGREIAARADWVEIRKGIGERLPMVHMDIALTSHGEQFGFFARSWYFFQLDQTGKMSDFGAALRRYWGDLAAGSSGRFHAESTTGQYPLGTFFPVRRGFSSDAVLCRGTPAGTFATEFDTSGVVDTPGDQASRVDFASLAAQVSDLEAVFLGTGVAKPGVLTDPRFYGRADLASIVTDQPLRLLERTLGETTPRLAAAEVLVGGEHEKDMWRWNNGGSMQGTRRFDWYFSHPYLGLDDDDVSIVLPSLQRFEFRLHALDFDADGLPKRCIVANTNDQRGLVYAFTPDSSRPARAMLFDCQQLSLFGLFDPRYMENLDKIELLDGRRLDKAQYSNVYARDGIAAVYMQPNQRWQVLVSKGDVTNRMVLINAGPLPTAGAPAEIKDVAAKGFTTTDLSEVGPLPWRAASDFYTLNSVRRANLERYGISNQIVDELQARTKALLDEGAAARDRKDYVGWMASAAAAWSLQEQVYAALIATSNGIIKGVIFLLLGIIPFSYFLERLLIGTTNVYKQIAWFGVIFAAMTASLMGHPAFRISSAPLMILLAFLILILSGTVIYILWGKFEEEISRLRGAGSAAHSTSLRRGAVFGAAIRLGLSNMRRRGMRTTLTLITLVLLTFTLLCFTSVRDTLSLTPRVVVDAPAGAPPGILLRQRGWKTLPTPALQMAREIAGDGPVAGGLISERWWYASEKAEGQWRLPVSPATAAYSTAAGAGSDVVFYAAGFVGLDPNEQQFQAADLRKLLPGWERLEAGEAVCLLPEDARALGVGTKVKVLGELLEVAGFFDPDKVQTQLTHLTGDEMTPTDPSGATSGSPGATQSTTPEELSAMPEMTYRYLPARTVAFIPARTAKRVGARLSSVMVRPARTSATTTTAPADTTPRLLTIAENLARRSAFTVYVSDGEHPVLSINSVESTRPQNLQKVLVPLIIAGVIVLNTMLGAVAERTREIHVYTSVGLAPSHVGMLFLAEAAALGTLGVVFGYVFGQGLATMLSHTKLISGVDLNYSSMAAIFTMGLVLALVMLSSLWPARAATRVAAPSLQRDWKLPRPQGDYLQVELPFTVNQVAAKGVCAFLEEYMVTSSQMGGAGGGRFTADQVRTFEETGGAGIRGLACRIWLAPYDLGVIQSFWLAIHPTHDAHVFEVRLTIVREAGNPGTWFRLNRPFLVEIRKQFLLWRAVGPDQVAEYVARSQAMFEHPEAKLPPVPGTTGERVA